MRPLRSATFFLFAALLPVAAGAEEPTSFSPDKEGFAQIATPYFETHCISCHGNKKSKGELNLETQIKNDFLDLTEAGLRRMERGVEQIIDAGFFFLSRSRTAIDDTFPCILPAYLNLAGL